MNEETKTTADLGVGAATYQAEHQAIAELKAAVDHLIATGGGKRDLPANVEPPPLSEAELRQGLEYLKQNCSSYEKVYGGKFEIDPMALEMALRSLHRGRQ